MRGKRPLALTPAEGKDGSGQDQPPAQHGQPGSSQPAADLSGQPQPQQLPRRNLTANEQLGGHTLGRHVNVTEDQVRLRAEQRAGEARQRIIQAQRRGRLLATDLHAVPGQASTSIPSLEQRMLYTMSLIMVLRNSYLMDE
uniref:Uncharacterized protein n=1 Tax=Thermogemmatispora argillosa TaxID=2045280 RepID=A0A455T0G0_9CHLR|nr:hypothetical protein KTA_15370 [Thermogemmatispora argillosa]